MNYLRAKSDLFVSTLYPFLPLALYLVPKMCLNILLGGWMDK